jgi:DUF971 family protein
MTGGSKHWPEELRVNKSERTLEVSFEDGRKFSIPAELLRVESPSAEVQGHGPGQKVLIHGRAHVGIIGVEPVGNYAVRLKFDDLHDSGIYTWDFLYAMGENKDQMWLNYLDALDAAGLSRFP